MFGFMKSPLNKITKTNSVDPPGSSTSNPFDSAESDNTKQRMKPARRTSSEPVLSDLNSNPFDDDDDDDDDGRKPSSTSHSANRGGRSSYQNDFRGSGGFENQSVEELENYAVYKAEETTKSVNSCLKIAEDIREDASKTLVTLHQQGEQITRTHEMCQDIDQDLSRGEKLLGSLGGMFSKTWKPKKTRAITGPLITADDSSKAKASKEQREKLGVALIPKGPKNSRGSTVESSSQNPRITWKGCSVLLDINDGDRLVFARLSASATLKIGDKKCSLQPLIGCPFGSMFQVEVGQKGPHLCRIFAADAGDQTAQLQEKDEIQQNERKDNRALVDDNTAQTLSFEDINAMKREGAAGRQIVDALIANSSTYMTKTAFSQEKYKLKKQKKYAPKVLLRRPFTRSISEAYFKKYPARVGFLRMDVLSLLLSMANVSANSDVLVVDMVGGILTGAVAERLGGYGHVCNTYFGVAPYPMEIVRIFNFSNEICRRIVRFPFTDLSLLEINDSGHSEIGKNAMSIEMLSNSDEAALSTTPAASSGSLSKSEDLIIQQAELPDLRSNPVNNEEPAPSIDDENSASSVVDACKSQQPGKKATKEAITSWKENGFSSLIIAAPDLDPWTVVQELLPHLSYSAPFVIYHQYLQPLASCMHNLQTARMAIALQISEPWLREYQVLPSRTHPCMQMSGFGGYILNGIRIYNNEVSIKPSSV